MGRDNYYSAKSDFVFRAYINGTKAIAGVKRNALSEFKPGDTVRAVIVLHHDDDQADGSRVRAAFPDHRHKWRVDRIDGNTLHLIAADSGDTVATALIDVDRAMNDLQAAVSRLRSLVTP
ncbi:hypothetical protein [Sedimentitalea sp.]|uniref:hypothetical protein n=1 Tax=Sedimentitalea sp. TaxID=2048915 RepID=UPI003299F3E4